MDFSQNGINLLKQLEGFREYPYLDNAGYWTIGYGTRIAHDNTGAFSIDHVDDATATGLLVEHVQHTVGAINRLVVTQLSQNQFDALVIFVYNIGEEAFSESTMLTLLNDNNTIAAANQFDRWVYSHGEVNPGLKNRRAAEKKLFMDGMTSAQGNTTTTTGC